MDKTLSDENVDAIISRLQSIEELLLELKALDAESIAMAMTRLKSPVLNSGEAMKYVGKRSRTAFDRWCTKWKVKPCDNGRYSRQKLDYALNQESKKVHHSNRHISRAVREQRRSQAAIENQK